MTDTRLRIIFMGTPDFAVIPLAALHEGGFDIIAVYSQPPRPKGRGHKLQPSPVHDYAAKNDIPVFHPKSLKTAASQKEFSSLKPDVGVVAAYGLILPPEILQAPTHGCINIHASLLPRWRGASPIQQAIWAGDQESGVTLMQMDEGLDTGPMIAVQSTPITHQTTASMLHDNLAQIGADMIVSAMQKLAAGQPLPSQPQESADATYAPLLTKQDGRIDWSQSAAQIDRQIRALTPWPGVWTAHKDSRIKILTAILSDCHSERQRRISLKPGDPSSQAPQDDKIKPGTILNRHGAIACGDGTTLVLHKIQPAGAKAMDIASAMNGGYIEIGDQFT